MKASEDVIDVPVVTPVVPPTFDNNIVVPENFKVSLSTLSPGDGVDK
jgi:hypothetical protein